MDIVTFENVSKTYRTGETPVTNLEVNCRVGIPMGHPAASSVKNRTGSGRNSGCGFTFSPPAPPPALPG